MIKEIKRVIKESEIMKYDFPSIFYLMERIWN